MVKIKRQFHCEKCGSPCEIYKKGKKHRVLVCPLCGVLATNPKAIAKVAKGLLRSVPVVGDVAAEFIGTGKDKSEKPSRSQKVITDSLDKPNKGERYVNLALKG